MSHAPPTAIAPLPTCAILAGHPDDEVLSATALLLRGRSSSVLRLTDGAPRDPRFWSPAAKGSSREQYAERRHRESLAALQLAGLDEGRVERLGCADQEAVFEAAPLARAVARWLRAHRPEVLLVHAYDGGHPDHDAAALIGRAAARLLQRESGAAPAVWEMAGYFSDKGQLAFGRFANGPPGLELELTGAERAQKRAMIACFATQRGVLERFPFDREALRPATRVDFSQPPRPGRLLYEQLGFPLNGEAWRGRAMEALRQLDLPACL